MQRYSQPDNEVYRAHTATHPGYAMPADLAARAFRSVAGLTELDTWHPQNLTLLGPR